MMPNQIPARSSSRYAGQYAKVGDIQRLRQIFTESIELALNSQNVGTATSRYELAIEAYFQLLTLSLPGGDRQKLQESMTACTAALPTQMCINEARGLCVKAAKLKTPKRRLEYLQLACAALERGLSLGLGGGQEFKDVQQQVLADIATVQAQA